VRVRDLLTLPGGHLQVKDHRCVLGRGHRCLPVPRYGLRRDAPDQWAKRRRTGNLHHGHRRAERGRYRKAMRSQTPIHAWISALSFGGPCFVAGHPESPSAPQNSPAMNSSALLCGGFWGIFPTFLSLYPNRLRATLGNRIVAIALPELAQSLPRVAVWPGDGHRIEIHLTNGPDDAYNYRYLHVDWVRIRR